MVIPRLPHPVLSRQWRIRACSLSRQTGSIGLATSIAKSQRRYGSNEGLSKTPFYEYNIENGAKMVPFAGFSMPVLYSSLSIIDSHLFTRKCASLFDVSHMVQHVIKGPDAAVFLERVTPSTWQTLGKLQGKLTVLLWPETGGIVDDSVITRIGEDEFHVVTNGACLEKDSRYLDDELGRFGGKVEWSRLDGSGLVALQGPLAAGLLKASLASPVDLNKIYFGNSFWAELMLAGNDKTLPVLISRGGYTGEDGFELSFNSQQYPGLQTTMVPAVKELVARAGPDCLQLAGLGARNSLRLEAGMCLYGNDLDDTTTPAEAGLGWIIPQERRKLGGFHGAEVILPQLKLRKDGGRGVERRRVGLVVKGAPAREGAKVLLGEEPVGVVTSGGPSPSLGRNIAMGYVKDGLHKAGTELNVLVRGVKREAVVTKMPFVTTRYHKGSV